MEVFQWIVLWVVIPAVLFFFLIETAGVCIREQGGQGFFGVAAGIVLALFCIVVLSPFFNLHEFPFLGGWNTPVVYLILFVVGAALGFLGTLGMRLLFNSHIPGIAGLILTFGFAMALYSYLFFADIKVISECLTFGLLFGTFFRLLFVQPNWNQLIFVITWSRLFKFLRILLKRK